MRVSNNTKFLMVIPNTYNKSVYLDRINDNTYGKDDTKKEMKNVEYDIKFINDGRNLPIGFKRIICHLIFDVKFDLTRKSRYVGSGHFMQMPASMSYSGIVSRDSVRIILLIAALNDLDINMCDIGND